MSYSGKGAMDAPATAPLNDAIAETHTWQRWNKE